MLDGRRGDRDFSLGGSGVPDRDHSIVEDPHEISMSLSERNRNHSTASLIDSMERRTQRTYRYGIGLVCVGATLNWLGFAQGNGYIDPLRYLGVACVISGSFCVCLAMCRWLGRPISVASHRDDSLNGRNNGDVHVINVAVPMYVPPMHEEYRPTKPPDYEIVAGEPPPYDEAIKLSPGALFSPTEDFFSSCQPSPSHSSNLTCSLLQNEVLEPNVKSGRSNSNPTGGAPPPYDANPQDFRRHSTTAVTLSPTANQTQSLNPQNNNANQNLLLTAPPVRGASFHLISPNSYPKVQNQTDVQSSGAANNGISSNVLCHPPYRQSDDNLLNIVSISNSGSNSGNSAANINETVQPANLAAGITTRTYLPSASQQPQIHQSTFIPMIDHNNGNDGFSNSSGNG